MKKTFSDLQNKLLDFFFPPKCPVCMTLLSDDEHGLCGDCKTAFDSEKRIQAPDCKKENINCECEPDVSFNNNISRYLHLVPYNLKSDKQIGKRLVIYCKDHNSKPVFEFLGKELADLCREKLRLKDSDCITYVPRGNKAKKMTGIDQSFYLAMELSNNLNIDLYSAIKHKKGKQQKSLGVGDRIINASSSFITGKDISKIVDRRVILVDDVVTSGSTMSACANLLITHGARSVVSLSICKSYHV